MACQTRNNLYYLLLRGICISRYPCTMALEMAVERVLYMTLEIFEMKVLGIFQI